MRSLAPWVAAVMIGLAGLPALCLAAQTPSLSTILAQARSAQGGDALDRVSALHLSGRITLAGIGGTFEEWDDSRSVTYSDTYNAGPLTGAQGFDGVNAWNQDSGGVTWVDGGKAGRYSAIATAYLTNDCFLRPSRRGSVAFAGVQKLSGVTYDVLRATPPNGLPLEIWLNANTHLAAREIVTVGIQTTTLTLDSYHKMNGVMVPFHSRSVSDTGNESDETVTQVQMNPPDAAAHLEMADTHPSDYAIAGGSETTVPIQVIDNHVYISVMLNGKGPFRFAFDTGGANLVDSSIVQALGLQTSGSFQGSGVGAQTEGLSFAKVATVNIGSAQLTNQDFVVLPIRQGFSAAAGVPLDGLIGFEVLARFVTTFDYEGLHITLQLPQPAVPQVRGTDVVPFVFNGTIPQVACQLDGIPGDCSVDTGSRLSLSVLTPFVAAHPTVVPATATAAGVDGFGIGGAAIGRLGRLQSLQIGNTVLPDLIADFSVQQKGYFANPFIAANIGGGVWRRFSVIFDYPDQTMTLMQNSAFAERDTYDRSGLFLIAPGGQCTVADVRAGTPADQAGVMRGDVVLSINGKATSTMDLLAIRNIFSGPAGTVVHLVVQGKTGAQRPVMFTLRDYV
jgi:PDZ domain/Aspartyl protease